MQGGGEHRAFDLELEGSAAKKFFEHRLDAGVLPQAAEQERRADPAAGELLYGQGIPKRDKETYCAAASGFALVQLTHNHRPEIQG